MNNESLPSKEELLKYLRTSEARYALEVQFLVSGKVKTSQLARFEAGRTISACLVMFGNDPDLEGSATGVKTPLFSFEQRVDGAEYDTCRIGSSEVRTEIGCSFSPLRFFPKGPEMEIIAAKKKLDWFKSSPKGPKVVALRGASMSSNVG